MIEIFPYNSPRDPQDWLRNKEFKYTYILSETNEISFNTHLLVIAYYVHMYSVTLCFPL